MGRMKSSSVSNGLIMNSYPNYQKAVKLLAVSKGGQYVTILFKQTSTKISGEFLGRLVLGEEDGLVKVFGATIF